jgi:hypothetical protein
VMMFTRAPELTLIAGSSSSVRFAHKRTEEEEPIITCFQIRTEWAAGLKRKLEGVFKLPAIEKFESLENSIICNIKKNSHRGTVLSD